MAEVWDIARYVEDHPDDYAQRWRLAKKLYMAWEYRLALEHLQVLKNDGHNRLNVVRYLAATYYRLGRYDEAVRELDEALETWPDEVGLHEQRARVLEIAGDRERAAAAWAQINEIDPQHPIAASAVRRLKKRDDDTPVRDLRIEDSDSGIDLRPGRVCPNCGAQNSEEFDRCWQCHALLVGGGTRSSGRNVVIQNVVAPFIPEELLLTGLGVLSVLVIAAGLFLSLRMIYAVPDTGMLITSVWDVYQYEMAALRIGTGIAGLFAWPMALWASVLTVRPRQVISPALINFGGLFLAGLTYSATWLPRELLFFVPVLPVVLSLALILGAFRIGAARAFAVWILHMGICVALLYGTAAVIERVRLGAFFNPFREFLAVYAYEAGQASRQVDGAYPLPDGNSPLAVKARWNSTGSDWLDSAAGEVEFTVFNETNATGLKFEIKDSLGTVVYEDITGERHTRRYRVRSGDLYTVEVGGTPGAPVRVVAAGLLAPTFEP